MAVTLAVGLGWILFLGIVQGASATRHHAIPTYEETQQAALLHQEVEVW